MLKGIVFDLDGTIVDSLSATFDAFNHGIVSLGGRKHTPQEIMEYFGPGEGEIFAQILGRDKAEQAYEACRNYMDANLGRVPLHEGMGDLLEQLKSKGIPISIFTGRSWNTTEMILKHHGLLDRFITVVANDHVSQPKPSSEGLLLALSRMKLQGPDVLYVGDNWVDMRVAHGAKSTAVAALWDLMAHRESLAQHSPHHWAEKPQQLWEIWERTNGA